MANGNLTYQEFCRLTAAEQSDRYRTCQTGINLELGCLWRQRPPAQSHATTAIIGCPADLHAQLIRPESHRII